MDPTKLVILLCLNEGKCNFSDLVVNMYDGKSMADVDGIVIKSPVSIYLQKKKKKKSLSLLLRFSPYLHLFTALALTLAASASVPTGNSVFNILFSIIHFKLLHYLHTGEGHFQWRWRLKEQHEEVSSLL